MRPEREGIRRNGYSYFVSTQTKDRLYFFRNERWAKLMAAVLDHYRETGYILHAYVIMPDHLHLLITPVETIEKSMQLIKGGFSFRAKKELEFKGEIWQPGFTDHRIRDSEDWDRHLEYIRLNPVEARLVEDSTLYEWMGFPSRGFPQGLKPQSVTVADVRAEARTLLQGAGIAAPEDEQLPRGLKPQFVEMVDVRAEARTLQNRDTPRFGSE